ncbi:MAG: hypothetical protein WD995_13645 [Gemmatimonadota bacterium]
MAAVSLAVFAACSEQTPTSIGNDVLPGEPITLSIEIPWEEFGSDLVVLGGYGAPSDIGTGVVANAFAGTLNARTLVRFGAYPQSASVVDTEGTTVTDTDLTIIGGRVVATINRRASVFAGPLSLTLGATQDTWDLASADWEHAVDTIGAQLPWTELGGGPVTPLDTATWDPSAAGDTISFVLDSAEVADWSDASDPSRGGRLDLVTEGHRLAISSVQLRLDARPSVNPDTIVSLNVAEREITFIYDPEPEVPTDGIRVGGAPAWRTVFDLQAPTELTGPPELCSAVGCPVTLEPGQISYAALVLRSRPTEAAFQPRDSLGLDVREVLSRDALPKAPLGSPIFGSQGLRYAASLFGDDGGTAVEIPITPLVRNLVEGVDPETQIPFPNTIALLSAFEPRSIAYGSFYGPGSGANAPVLKLIVTVGASVELP